MLSTEGSLMRAQQPPLEQSGDTMDAGHTDVGRGSSILKDSPVMSIAAFRQSVVAAPAIRQNLGASFYYIWGPLASSG